MKGRFAITISYLGTHYHGWQMQPNAITIQEVLTDRISSLQQDKVDIVGCGRTDAGVHAMNYVAHLDLVLPNMTIPDFKHKLNRMLPKDIVVHHVALVSETFHARFDALDRLYRYYINFEKDPFHIDTKYLFLQAHLCEWDKVSRVGEALLAYSEFAPFCKTNSDSPHYKCQLFESKWVINNTEAVFQIKSNRFLRGMVRLIVGMCLDVGLGKMSIDDIHHSMQHQSLLQRSWSVPAKGLYLEEINYPPEKLSRS